MESRPPLSLVQRTEPSTLKHPTRRRVLRVVAAVLGLVLVGAGSVAYWALDRFVLDDVAIADVAAYEAAAGGSGTAGTTVAPLPSTTVTAAVTATGPVVTESSYASSALSIEIEKVVTGSGADRIVSFVADVTVADAALVRSGFAENKFGQNIIANTSAIAARYGAVFAINGDYYGFRDSGILIRNGVLYRDDGARPGLALYRDGTMRIYDEVAASGEALVAAGVWNTLSFGPPLVDGGRVVAGIEDVEVDTNFGNHSIQGRQPRTGVGMIGPNHFVFVVVDGRSAGYSRGVTMTEFAAIFTGLGASTAYNLDGGGSSTMVFNGRVVNDPLGKGRERGTSDILYLAEPAA